MRILFLQQNFPGQFKMLAPRLAAVPGNHVIGMGDARNIRNRPCPAGVDVVAYKSLPRQNLSSHHYVAGFEAAVRRGQDVARACMALKARGFSPDVVVCHPAWGEALFIRDAYPEARLICYYEFFYHGEGADVGFDPEYPATLDDRLRVRIKNSVQLHALNEMDAGVSPTRWQRSRYPERLQARIDVIHEGFDLDVLSPRADASFRLADGTVLTRRDKVLTYVSRNLEPYRGFHVFMRALPDLLERCADLRVVIVGGDEVSYGVRPAAPYANYREQLLAEIGGRLAPARVSVMGRIPYADYISLMQVSSLHVYLTYPFVLSWSMLEAMACGAPVLASATAPVTEFIKDGRNGRLFDFFDRRALIDTALAMLENPQDQLRRQARESVLSGFRFEEHALPRWRRLVEGG